MSDEEIGLEMFSEIRHLFIILMIYLEPSITMSELLYSLQKFYLESDLLLQLCGYKILYQNQIYTMHYCSPYEKNQLLNGVFRLFFQQEEMPQQDVLYLDNQHNFKIPDGVFVANCISLEDMVVQLNAMRYILKKNAKIRMIIIDSVSHYRNNREARRKSFKVISEKVLNFEREVHSVIDELIDSLQAFNAIIIVLSHQQYMNNQVTYNNQMIQVSKRICDQLALTENSAFLIPCSLFDPELYKFVQTKYPQNYHSMHIVIRIVKGQLRYFLNNICGEII